MPGGTTRRDVLAAGAASLSCFLIAGQRVWASPADAVARHFTPDVLTASQVAALQRLGDRLVPGPADAGLAAFVDAQLAAGTGSKLMAKYVGVPVEQQSGFYSAALDAVHKALETTAVDELVGAMASDRVANWQGPPASYVYFLLRADALDVTYGTEQGFADLAIPYNAHIAPETTW